ncbi:methionine adenosyltransferase [Peptococcus niger]|uniref:S-adenosylmethionine synthase n=1 Tax=Peptococcus niger TaxID=2741 RepID=A0A1G6RVQ2_PEPNI|nr:methionine adenosyltransferase [Peptococcus niger]SDD08648.1 methionine adenosyltransferase [Peptococcus niger]
MKKFFTSESVTEGHPDKIADQISDAILDAILAKDPNARVACETFLTTGMVFISGEISTNCYVDMPKIARGVIQDIGYKDARHGFDYKTSAVITAIGEQSADIALGVDRALEAKEGTMSDAEIEAIGAGDQGMMFGYASDETPVLMPLPIYLAHALTRRLTAVRKEELLDYLLPDGKSQVTVEYDDGIPRRVDTVVISAQHTESVALEKLREDIINVVIKEVIPPALLDDDTQYFINPTGRFVIGGPQGDAGLTGRKIIVDTYGGMARHGGGALSGKDGTKVDRSGAYAARYVAKNIVAAGLAKRCEVQIAYAIGVARPMSVLVETFGTATVDEERLGQAVMRVFDLRPAAIIRDLELRKPMYRACAAYGHFGREDLDLPWERTDRAEALKEVLKD